MRTLAFTAEDKGDGQIVSKMEPSEFTIMEIIGILTNQANLLSEKARNQTVVAPVPRGSSQGSTH